MIRINYFGPARGAFRLSKMLKDENFEVSYDPPMETRSAGIEPAVHVAIFVGEHLAGGGIAAAGGLAVKKVVENFKKNHPGVDLEVEENERPTDSE